jgi:NADH:ubiquinone oxidoreductase subunit H
MMALTGAYGTIYAARILARMIRMHVTQSYTPEIDDWFWYAIAPMVTYGAALAAAILLPTFPTATLFVLAACTIALIFVGIRNAWDVVTFLAIAAGDKSTRPSTSQRRAQ